MVQALTITITQATVGMVAVMILLAMVGGVASWAIASWVVYTGSASGSMFSRITSVLYYPLIIGSVIAGAYLGYRLMS